MSTSNAQVKHEALRKTLHVLLSTILLLPFNESFVEFMRNCWGIGPREYYAVLAVSAALVNAAQIKRPLIRDELLKMMRSARKKAMDEIKGLFLSKMSPTVKFVSLVDKLDDALTRLEITFSNQIKMLERSYERVSGYVGVTFGVIGAFSAFVLFKNYAFYGILALMIVDPVAALVTKLFGRKTLPMSRTSIEGAFLSVALFLLVLLIIGVNTLKALLISVIAAFSEAYGVEDNISIPLFVSLSAALLGV